MNGIFIFRRAARCGVAEIRDEEQQKERESQLSFVRECSELQLQNNGIEPCN